MENVMDSDPRRPLGLGNVHGSALGRRGISKRLDALGGFIPLRGERLLDIGCATGEYTEFLAAGFSATDAIDIEPERLNVFKEHLAAQTLEHPIVVTQMSAEDMSFGDATFDMVTAIEVLEHVPNLDATLSEVHRVLRPGGHLLVTGPNRFFPLESHGFLFRGRRHPPIAFPFLPWIPPLHRRMSDARSFTVTALRRVVEPHGFRLRAHTRLMPPFDRSRMGKKIRGFTDSLERTPLGVFGITLVMVFEKVQTSATKA
jgi:ubiquinone/menaquinone biosynthesis C-methylase UbiE